MAQVRQNCMRSNWSQMPHKTNQYRLTFKILKQRLKYLIANCSGVTITCSYWNSENFCLNSWLSSLQWLLKSYWWISRFKALANPTIQGHFQKERLCLSGHTNNNWAHKIPFLRITINLLDHEIYAGNSHQINTQLIYV